MSWNYRLYFDHEQGALGIVECYYNTHGKPAMVGPWEDVVTFADPGSIPSRDDLKAMHARMLEAFSKPTLVDADFEGNSWSEVDQARFDAFKDSTEELEWASSPKTK